MASVFVQDVHHQAVMPEQVVVVAVPDVFVGRIVDHPEPQLDRQTGKEDAAHRLTDQNAGRAEKGPAGSDEGPCSQRVLPPVEPGRVRRAAQRVERRAGDEDRGDLLVEYDQNAGHEQHLDRDELERADKRLLEPVHMPGAVIPESEMITKR